MPSEQFKRIDLDLIYPPFLERALALVASCNARGAGYYALSGTRWWAEQHRLRLLFMQGKGGRAAPAGYSAHQFGLAIDFAADVDPKPGLQPSWKSADYNVLGEEAKKLGLHWGAAYNDRPHVSWPGFVSGADLAPLRKIWATGKERVAALKLCWDYVDKIDPFKGK